MRKLMVEELFPGAWVQQYWATPGMCTSPIYIYGIWKDGRLFLDKDGAEPWDSDIRDVWPVPIDEQVLQGFGFVRTKGDNVWLKMVGDFRLTVGLRMRHGKQECRRCAFAGRTANWNEEIRYVHELQRWWVDKVQTPFGVELNLTWKGV